MQFDLDKSLTMDNSAIIEVYDNRGDEYIFSFSCNKKELLALQTIVKNGLQKIEDEKDMRAIQKTPEFWKEIKKYNGVCDTQKLLRNYRKSKNR